MCFCVIIIEHNTIIFTNGAHFQFNSSKFRPILCLDLKIAAPAKPRTSNVAAHIHVDYHSSGRGIAMPTMLPHHRNVQCAQQASLHIFAQLFENFFAYFYSRSYTLPFPLRSLYEQAAPIIARAPELGDISTRYLWIAIWYTQRATCLVFADAHFDPERHSVPLIQSTTTLNIDSAYRARARSRIVSSFAHRDAPPMRSRVQRYLWARIVCLCGSLFVIPELFLRGAFFEWVSKTSNSDLNFI